MSPVETEDGAWAWIAARPALDCGFVGDRDAFRADLMPTPRGARAVLQRELIWFRRHVPSARGIVQPVVWTVVPAGFSWDGASIPRALWTAAGHPFSTHVIRASCLHDFECTARVRPSTEVHRTFYDAIRHDGMGGDLARWYYRGVAWFGPRFPGAT